MATLLLFRRDPTRARWSQRKSAGAKSKHARGPLNLSNNRQENGRSTESGQIVFVRKHLLEIQYSDQRQQTDLNPPGKHTIDNVLAACCVRSELRKPVLDAAGDGRVLN